jgi:hypothetical protein
VVTTVKKMVNIERENSLIGTVSLRPTAANFACRIAETNTCAHRIDEHSVVISNRICRDWMSAVRGEGVVTVERGASTTHEGGMVVFMAIVNNEALVA